MYDCVGVSMSQSMRGYQMTIAGVRFSFHRVGPDGD